MITVLLSVFCLIAGYLLGSIMSAVKIARSKSTDIHACGSGNAGSTNVLRTFGWKWGLICLASDSAKGAASVGVGYAAAAIAPALFSNYVMPENLSGILGCIGLLGAILGHLLPVFYEFRGEEMRCGRAWRSACAVPGCSCSLLSVVRLFLLQ